MLSWLTGGSSTQPSESPQVLRTFSSLWAEDSKPEGQTSTGKKCPKSFAAWNDSGSDCDDAPIQIGPRGSKPLTQKQRTRSSFAGDDPPPNSWAAKRQAMLKLKEKESKIEISAEDWNSSLEAVQSSPSRPTALEQTPPSTRARVFTEPSPISDEASSPLEMEPSPSEQTSSEPRKVNAGYAKRRTASEPQKQRTRSAVAPSREKDTPPPRRANTNPAKVPTKKFDAVKSDKSSGSPVDGILLDEPPPRRAYTNPAKQPTKKIAVPPRSHSAVSTRPPPRSPGPKARPKTPSKDSPKEDVIVHLATGKELRVNCLKKDTCQVLRDKLQLLQRSPEGTSYRIVHGSDVMLDSDFVLDYGKDFQAVAIKESKSPVIDQDDLCPFFLASCPDKGLREGIDLVQRFGGFYAAGDKDDIFNKDVLVGEAADKAKAESWQVGWKGKVEMCFNMLRQLHPDKEYVWAIAVAGGPACDWERGELRNRFCKVHTDMKLKICGDLDDLEAWIERQGYREKVLNYAQRKAQEQVSHGGRKRA